MIPVSFLSWWSVTGGDYYLKFELQQRADGPATLLLFASRSVGLFYSVCLAQYLFEGFLISHFFHISQNMKSESYLLLKEQVVLCDAAFPLLSLFVCNADEIQCCHSD